jgi:hypothetical protein
VDFLLAAFAWVAPSISSWASTAIGRTAATGNWIKVKNRQQPAMYRVMDAPG